ncbi:hypothetical protein D3C85_1798360 [compost metagenome]
MLILYNSKVENFIFVGSVWKFGSEKKSNIDFGLFGSNIPPSAAQYALGPPAPPFATGTVFIYSGLTPTPVWLNCIKK